VRVRAHLLERGDLDEACGQLDAALRRSVERSPKDLVAGEAASDLSDRIHTLRDHLGCPALEGG
jgi:hypothetical protein